MNDYSKIWAIVLAAGESSRMKSPKLILPFRGKTIIETVIQNILDSDLRNVMLVTGAWKEEVLKAVNKMPVNHCINPNYKSGMLSSVICGINSLPAGTVAAVIFQGDQPEIGPEVINLVIGEGKKSEKGIIVPVSNNKRGHPLFIIRKYFAEVTRLDPDFGLRGLQTLFPDDILEVDVDDTSILKDIDTREDYLESINKKL
jgi:molybdenum cofactor cytidylyltransferase